MNQPTPDPRDARRRQILDAAVSVFATRGFHDARVQHVADEAGVAYGLVYHYYGSKSALLQEIFDRNWAVFADVVETLASEPRTPTDALRAVVDYVFGAFDVHPDVVGVLVREFGRTHRLGAALAHPDVARVAVAVRGIVARAEQELPPGADVASLTTIILGSVEAALASTLLDDRDPQRRARRATRAHATLVATLERLLSAPSSSR